MLRKRIHEKGFPPRDLTFCNNYFMKQNSVQGISFCQTCTKIFTHYPLYLHCVMHSDYISKLGKQKNSLKYGCRHCRSSFKISHDITVMLHLLDPFSMMKTGPRSHAFLGESPALGCDVSNLHLTWTRGRKTLSTYPAGLRLDASVRSGEHE